MDDIDVFPYLGVDNIYNIVLQGLQIKVDV